MSFLKRKNKPLNRSSTQTELIACLDIEETVVSVALISPTAAGLSLVGYGQAFVDQEICLHQAQPTANVLSNACYQALKAAKGQLTTPLKDLAISVSGAFIQEITHKSQFRRPNANKVFNEAERHQLVTRNQTEAMQQAWAAFSFENSGFQAQLELLNSSLIGFALDGHPVLNPLGQTASFVGLQLYNVFLSKPYSLVYSEIANKLNLNLVSLAYKPFALSRTFLGNTYRPDLEAILIHVEHDFSHVILIRNGLLVRSYRFELGSASFDKALRRNLVLRRLTIDSLKDGQGNFDFSALEATDQQQATKILNHTNSVWQLSLITALKQLQAPKLPSNIYLTGRGANYGVLRRGLGKMVSNRSLNFKAKPTISTLKLAQLEGITTTLSSLNDNHLMVLIGLGNLTLELLQRPSPTNQQGVKG